MKRTVISMALVSALCGLASAQVIERESVDANGVQGNNDSRDSAVSKDGRFVAFLTFASNLDPNSGFFNSNIFVRDRQTGTLTRVTVSTTGGAPDSSSNSGMAMSPDGRFVVFGSQATNLVAGDTNAHDDVFLRDLLAGITERVSLDSAGAQANGFCGAPSISADGRFVAFESFATNLVAGDTNGFPDIFVKDRQTGAIERVSIDSAGNQSNGNSRKPVISADGRFVLFRSDANNLVAGDTNGVLDLFLRDRQLGTTIRVNVSSAGAEANGQVTDAYAMTPDARFVAFASFATNLVTGDTNGVIDIFVRDLQTGTTTRASVSSTGAQGSLDSFSCSISDDGRFVAIESKAALTANSVASVFSKVFVHDMQTGETVRVDVSGAGDQANETAFDVPQISGDGRFVTFSSGASNLVAGDTNGFIDVFLSSNPLAPAPVTPAPAAEAAAPGPSNGGSNLCGGSVALNTGFQPDAILTLLILAMVLMISARRRAV